MATFGALTELTITLVGITDGQGRIGAEVDNSTDEYQRIFWFAEITTGGSAHDDGSVVEVWAYRADGGTPEFESDGTALADADLSTRPVNAVRLGSIIVGTATATEYNESGIWDGPGVVRWTIALWNATGQTWSTNDADSFVRWYGEKA